MTGIEELLLTIALDFTSDKIEKLIKGKETLESDLLRSYNDALKEWSKNDDIRRMTARNFSTHFKQLGEYIKSPSSQIKGTEISKLLNIWESKLRNYDNTYHYLLEKRTDKILEVIDSVRSVVDRINSQFEVKIQNFENISDYIPRQTSMEIGNVDFFRTKSTFKLTEIIIDTESYPKLKFILYSSAQTGKTTELKYLAYKLQESDLFNPFFYDLSKYVPATLYERLKSTVIQYDGVMFLLDGYDEIKDSNKSTFLGELNLFISDFPHIPIILSSRINFEDQSLFQDFQPLYLEPLSLDDIYAYIDKNYTDIRRSFIDKAHSLGVMGLLQTPFYLKEMLKYFSLNNDLPKTKSELYKILINESFRVDEKHKPEKGYVQQLKTKGYKILQKVAFVMTLCEKKELSEYELSEVLTEEEFQIAIHFSIFKRDASKLMYSFEHIAFKEFLMAEFLISVSENEVVKLIFYPESNKLIKSWYNIVLLFLELLQDIPEKFQSIIDTLIENDNHVIVYASPKFLSKAKRIEIFKQIYSFYSNKGLYIDYFEFRKSLMFFANFEETILFLLNQLKLEGSIADYYNVLVLLEYADYGKLREKGYARQTLKEFLNIKQRIKELQNYLILPFYNKEYANKTDTEDIGEIIKNNEQAEILKDYFELLLRLENIDVYAEEIFKHQKHIMDYADEIGVHHMISRDIVYQIYDKFISIENIANALIYTASEKGYLSRGKDEQIGIKKKLLLKLSDLYRIKPDEQIIEKILNAFVQEDFSPYRSDQYEIETALLYKYFFVSIGKVESILNNEYAILKESLSKNTIDHRRELLIPLLMTEDYFITKMHSYDKTDLAGYYHMKYSLSFDDDLSKKFSEQLEAYFSITKPNIRDWQKEKQDDFDLILDYQRFKKEVEYHCDTGCEFVYKFRNRDLISDDFINNCVDYFLYEFTIDEKINIEAAREAINDLEKYSKFSLIHISHYMNYGNEETSILANEKQKQVINELVNQTISKGVDADNLEALLAAITFFDFDLTEEQIRKFMPLSYRNIPNHIGYKYRLKGNELDDLTFSYNTNLLDFLIYKSSEKFINNQIISIIDNENKHNEILYRALADYIVQNKINRLYKFLPIILFDKLDDEYDKRQVLYYISRIENSYSLIEERFEELSDESKISYFSYLKEGKVPELICETLWEIYQRTDGDLKLKCLSVLLINGCRKALDDFIIFLKGNQYATADKFPRLSYIGEEYLDSLIEILEIILPKVDINHNRFVDVVLYPIEETAIMNSENLEKVTKAFEQIIEKNNDYHFLNRKIISMTDRFYESGRFNRTIKEALKEFQYLTD